MTGSPTVSVMFIAIFTFWLQCKTIVLDTEHVRSLFLQTGSLHGASASALLSRLIWLYLHSGEQLYMEAVKQTVLQSVHARLVICSNILSADLWQLSSGQSP